MRWFRKKSMKWEAMRGKGKDREGKRRGKKHCGWLNLEDEQPGRGDRKGADRKQEGKSCGRVKGRSSSKREWLSGGKLLRESIRWELKESFRSQTRRASEISMIEKALISSYLNVESFRAWDYEWKSHIVLFINGLLIGPNKCMNNDLLL